MTTRPERIALFYFDDATVWTPVTYHCPATSEQTEYIRSDVVEGLLREARQQERERCAAAIERGWSNSESERFREGYVRSREDAAFRIRALTDDDGEKHE